MRYIAIALLLLVPVAADAQRPNAARRYNQEVRARQAPPPPGFHNPLYQRDHRNRRDHRDFDRWPQTHRSRWKGQSPGYQYPFGSYYAVPGYGYGYGFGYFSPAPENGYDSARYAQPEIPQQPVSTGMLRLEITPASALSYYVDGLYIGSSSDLGMQFSLNPGARRVEVRATGYKPLVFDTRITAGQITTFRAALEPLTQPQAPQATGNPTMFIIPGCYMGNARPTASELRRGCDIKKLVTR